VLTAGGKNQEVLDGGNNGHSVFTGRLIELLEKTDDFITANEIQAIIKEKVNGDARARNHQQTPSYGTLYGSGDFVFIPSLEQKVADNKAEIAKLEAELKAMDAAAAKAKLNEQARLQRDADLVKAALAGKLKAEQLKKDQLAAEEKRRADEEAERQRLAAAKGEDDIKLAALKAAADAKRKAAPTETAGDFSTFESAVAEIKRLNAQINSIETGYEKELVQTRFEVNKRYDAQIYSVNQTKQDEFESKDEFKAKIQQQRESLYRSRVIELARLDASKLAAAETIPLRDSIKRIAERVYSIGPENIQSELGAYDIKASKFPVILKSRSPNIKLAINGIIPLPLNEAKSFKQQWVSGLVRLEGKVKVGGEVTGLTFVNDADNSRLSLKEKEGRSYDKLIDELQAVRSVSVRARDSCRTLEIYDGRDCENKVREQAYHKLKKIAVHISSFPEIEDMKLEEGDYSVSINNDQYQGEFGDYYKSYDLTMHADVSLRLSESFKKRISEDMHQFQNNERVANCWFCKSK
jgi:hypothetical protein